MGTRSEEKMSKKLLLAFLGNRTTTQTHLKLEFFRVLAHCAL